MRTHARILGAGALAALLVAACARDGDRPPQEGTTTTTPTGEATEGLDAWNPSPEEIDIRSEQEYRQQASQQIHEGNVEEEFRRLQEELGGGGG